MHLHDPKQILEHECHTLRQRLEGLDAQALARRSGFLRRCPRKIPIVQLLLALVALAAESFLTLERIASGIALAAQLPYSKQALHKRLTPTIERFLALVATALFGQLPQAQARLQGLFQPFRRVLLHDSTVQTLPGHLVKIFPGSRNQRQRYAALKIQYIADLISSQVLHLSLSGFTRNDQAAAPDILEVAQSGDLIIRDLGYFVLRAFQWIHEIGAFFLSRCRTDLTCCDARTDQPLKLSAELRRYGHLDREVFLGAQKVRVRLVALPVPEAVANERRRKAKAKAQRDRRSHPSAEHLFLLGWNLLITNVPRSLWPAKVLAAIYRLRWRIEMIFKAWKSHLGLRHFHCRSANVLRLSVMTKLLFCVLVYRCCQSMEHPNSSLSWVLSGSVLVYRCCQSMELLGGGEPRHVSLQRLARILGAFACVIQSYLLGRTPEQLLEHSLGQVFYEQRRDRKNFCQLLAEVTIE